MTNSRIKKFFSYYKPYRGLFFADMVCALIVSVTTLLIPLGANYITKNVLANGLPDALTQIYGAGAVMLGLIAVHTAGNMFVDYHGHRMGAMMERDMRGELFAHLQKLSFGFYDEQKTGQLMTRITNDSFDLSELYHHGPEDVVISLLNFAGAFLILLTINVELAWMFFLFLPPMAVFVIYFNQKMKAALRRSKDRIGDVNAQVEDTLAGIRVVKSFTNETIESRKFAHENDRFLASRADGYKNEAYFSGGMSAFTLLLPVAVIVFGGIRIVNASLDLADLITFLLYVGILIEPIRRFSNFTRLYQEGMTGFERFMEILEVAPDIQDAPGAVELEHVRGDVEFQAVSFTYRRTISGASPQPLESRHFERGWGTSDALRREIPAGQPDRGSAQGFLPPVGMTDRESGVAEKLEQNYVLRNISLTIRAGEYVALVGSSGVGKTTLCSLIPRFYEINAGQILLDGRDIREIRLRSLRKNIGVVQQDVYLFAGTVADNIRYGNPEATREAIIAAAQKANAHAFITALPNGYDTDIGQRGVKLSGGQKQRLSIARVFLKDPPILIFDEATSALDNESEKAVQESLEKLAHNRTTLVIAHRLSTIRNAQRIVVLTDNGIEEQGTHVELMALGGAYANLYNVQGRI